MAGYLMDQDEIVHNIMHAAQQQVGHVLGALAGHVSSYNPVTNMVRCLVPSIINPTTGQMKETGWLPLLTPMMGSGFGFQYAPFGGATQDNLQAGEQVRIAVMDFHQATYYVGAYTWNNSMPVAKPDIQAGELFISDAYGNSVYWQKGGIMTVSGATVVNVITETSNVNASKEANITAPVIHLGADKETLLPLVTQAMQGLYNEHTHPIPDGNTGTPNQTMTDAQLTSTVEAG